MGASSHDQPEEAVDRILEATKPAERVSVAITTVIERVRATPSLSMWFEADSVGVTNELAVSSDVLERIATAVVAPALVAQPTVR
jgi:hypothetical protein